MTDHVRERVVERIGMGMHRADARAITRLDVKVSDFEDKESVHIDASGRITRMRTRAAKAMLSYDLHNPIPNLAGNHDIKEAFGILAQGLGHYGIALGVSEPYADQFVRMFSVRVCCIETGKEIFKQESLGSSCPASSRENLLMLLESFNTFVEDLKKNGCPS